MIEMLLKEMIMVMMKDVEKFYVPTQSIVAGPFTKYLKKRQEENPQHFAL